MPTSVPKTVPGWITNGIVSAAYRDFGMSSQVTRARRHNGKQEFTFFHTNATLNCQDNCVKRVPAQGRQKELLQVAYSLRGIPALR